MTDHSGTVEPSDLLEASKRSSWLTHVPRALVLFGAACGAASLVAGYLGVSTSFGLHRAMALAAGIGAILSGLGVDLLVNRLKRADAFRFVTVIAQVSLLIATFDLLNIENAAFYRYIGVLALFGFIANHYLPQTLRLPFFVGLSVAGIIGVFGFSHIASSLFILGAGVALIGICHLPVKLWMRVALLLTVGAGLAVVRAGYIETPWMGIALPVFASMFMFRLAIYLHDTEIKKGATNIWHRLGYFFMLPNVVFPFFPVVDYTTFSKTYYNDEALKIYERGADLMLRGLIHLLIYRVVNYYFVLSAADVTDPASFFQYIFANFGLYFRISGQFHLITGILLLFGFNLHDTHKRFYMSRSFVDMWRNQNIYWKDFMQKMFFNPSFVFLKSRGASFATGMVLASLWVFFGTWALHAYQWFWLRGSALLTFQDEFFWVLIASLFVIQTFNETLKPRPRGRTYLLGVKASIVLRTVSFMLVLCVLWSLWASTGLQSWFDLIGASGLVPAFSEASPDLMDWLTTLVVLGLAGVMLAFALGYSLGIMAPEPAASPRKVLAKKPAPKPFAVPQSAIVASAVVVIAVLTNPATNAVFGPAVQTLARDISQPRLSRQDQKLLTRGYYEKLTNVGGFNSQLWDVLMYRPKEDTDIRDLAGVRKRGDYLEYEFVPMSSSTYNHAIYDINRWGMRDKDYARETPPDTYRIAMTGSSRLAGEGVAYEDRFETLLETALNAQFAGRRYKTYEVLNFAVDGYYPSQVLLNFKEKALAFKPTVMIEDAALRDLDLTHQHAQMLAKGVAVPDFLQGFADRAGVKPGMNAEQIERLLQPYRAEMLEATYRSFVSLCRESGITPIWLYVPQPQRPTAKDREDLALMTSLAQEAGFLTLDLSDAYGDEDLAKLQNSDWDTHPNPAAHKRIMTALLNALIALDQSQKLVLGFRQPSIDVSAAMNNVPGAP